MPKKVISKNGSVKKKPSIATGKPGGPNVSSLAKRLDQLMQRIPRGAFAAAGGAIGGTPGAMVGRAISNITGYGDYSVSQNTVSRQGFHGGVEVPSFSNKSVRVTHREYFADVIVPENPTEFHNTAFDLSPTNPQLAPWISKIAEKYSKYKIHGLVFYYKPMSTDYNNSGTVAITVNYDPQEDKFETLNGMLNSKFAVSGKPSCAIVAPVECDPSTLIGGGTMLIDHPTLGAVADKRFTSIGALNVATSGLTMPIGSILGQLHMTIDLELINPFLHVRQYQSPLALYAAIAVAGPYVTVEGGASTYGVEVKRGKTFNPAAGFDSRYVQIAFGRPGRYAISRIYTTTGNSAGIANIQFEDTGTALSDKAEVTEFGESTGFTGPAYKSVNTFIVKVTEPVYMWVFQLNANAVGTIRDILSIASV
jgi:hypothetical protein